MSTDGKNAGLRGVSAGETAIATVGDGHGLRYRGYDVVDLAAQSTFEEIAWLLLRGALPTARELDGFRNGLRTRRELPGPLCDVLEQIPPTAHPMDVLRTGCSMLGTLEPEQDFAGSSIVAERLIAAFPGMLLYWHHFAQHGQAHRDDHGRAEHRGAFPAASARRSRRARCMSARWTRR